MSCSEILKAIEAVLAEHQVFGNSDYIHERLHVCYERRLTRIAGYLPVARQLLDALDRAHIYCRYRVIGDTVVRCAIQHALKQLETGTQYGLPLDQCEEVFRATIGHIEAGESGAPSEAGVAEVNRLGPDSCHGWVWSEEHSDDV